MSEMSLTPLSSVKTGQVVKIAQILGGAGVTRRLNAMGVNIDTKIKKISSVLSNGPLVFEVKGTQIAIGRGIAQKILVKI